MKLALAIQPFPIAKCCRKKNHKHRKNDNCLKINCTVHRNDEENPQHSSSQEYIPCKHKDQLALPPNILPSSGVAMVNSFFNPEPDEKGYEVTRDGQQPCKRDRRTALHDEAQSEPEDKSRTK